MRRRNKTDSTLGVLREISVNVQDLGGKLDKLIDLQKKHLIKGPMDSSESSPAPFPFDVDSIVSLPDHLIKTGLVIAKIERGTALDVAKETGRARAAESDYLNQLVSMGYLKKKRSMRKVVFYLED